MQNKNVQPKCANNANRITNMIYNLKEQLKLAATVQCHSHTLVSSSWSVVVVVNASGMSCPVDKVFRWPEHMALTVSVHFHLQQVAQCLCAKRRPELGVVLGAEAEQSLNWSLVVRKDEQGLDQNCQVSEPDLPDAVLQLKHPFSPVVHLYKLGQVSGHLEVIPLLNNVVQVLVQSARDKLVNQRQNLKQNVELC